jgi:hypothetical protein
MLLVLKFFTQSKQNEVRLMLSTVCETIQGNIIILKLKGGGLPVSFARTTNPQNYRLKEVDLVN